MIRIKKYGNDVSLLDYYTLDEKIGSGSYGDVFKATKISDGSKHAIKRINKKNKYYDKIQIDKEIKIMEAVSCHPHIVKLGEVFEETNYLYLVMELVEGGELFDRLVNLEEYSESIAVGILKQLLEVVASFHSINIVHRDIKPENLLLVGPGYEIKLTDFGLSEDLSGGKTLKSCVGSKGYIAPEILKLSIKGAITEVRTYGVESDIWSIGIILYILLCGYSPFDPEDEKAMIEGRISFDDESWKKVSDEAKDLLLKLLEIDPSKRISAKDALKHKWFQITPPAQKLLDTLEKLKKWKNQKNCKASTINKLNKQKTPPSGNSHITLLPSSNRSSRRSSFTYYSPDEESSRSNRSPLHNTKSKLSLLSNIEDEDIKRAEEQMEEELKDSLPKEEESEDVDYEILKKDFFQLNRKYISLIAAFTEYKNINQQEIESYDAKIFELDETNHQLEEENQNLQNEVNSLEEIIEELKANKRRVNAEHLSQLEQLMKELEYIEEGSQHLETELKFVREKLFLSEQIIKEQNIKIENLENQLKDQLTTGSKEFDSSKFNQLKILINEAYYLMMLDKVNNDPNCNRNLNLEIQSLKSKLEEERKQKSQLEQQLTFEKQRNSSDRAHVENLIKELIYRKKEEPLFSSTPEPSIKLKSKPKLRPVSTSLSLRSKPSFRSRFLNSTEDMPLQTNQKFPFNLNTSLSPISPKTVKRPLKRVQSYPTSFRQTVLNTPSPPSKLELSKIRSREEENPFFLELNKDFDREIELKPNGNHSTQAKREIIDPKKEQTLETELHKKEKKLEAEIKKEEKEIEMKEESSEIEKGFMKKEQRLEKENEILTNGEIANYYHQNNADLLPHSKKPIISKKKRESLYVFKLILFFVVLIWSFYWWKVIFWDF